MTSFDQRDFRNALGTFATGITVITTTHNHAEPVGITVNSFASVSLDPPLVLWCLDNDAYFHDIFANCSHFAVHVLHQDQEAVSQIFSTKNSSKFNSLDWEMGEFGSPILKDCASHFECEMERQCDGGDHVILLGRVTAFKTHKDKPPLIYHAGEYQVLKIL